MTERDTLDVARGLLAKARGDEVGLRALEEHPDVPDHVVGFLAEQAVEKQIKSVLMAYEIPFRKTHELSYLVGLIDKHKIDAPAAMEQADTLTDWAVEFRYEGDEPPTLDRAAALTLVEALRKWADAQITAVTNEREKEQAEATQVPPVEPGLGQTPAPSS